jgi:two-component system cell cycle sensor histidine kinase/response regulator CckA
MGQSGIPLDTLMSKDLRTVSVPDAMREPFLRAQEYVARFFEDRSFDPTRSNITISGERYILVRAAAMSVEFFDLVMSLYADRGTQEARLVASNLLFDIAHSIGRGDARAFHERMNVVDPIERLSAGPIHFSFSGWAFVKILPESAPSPDESFYLIYEHPFSFESDSWIRRGRKSEYPVCIMNAGYSSGWCEESFGLSLVSAEVECQARGDAQCRFIMAPPSRIEGHLAHYLSAPERAAKRSWPSRPVPVSIPEFFQRKRLEEELKASRARLEHRVQERTAQLANANEALQAEIGERARVEHDRAMMQAQMQNAQKLDSLGALAGGIAHDFDNLLVVMLGSTETVLEQLPQDSPLLAPLAKVKQAAERAALLTRQMLAYAGQGRVQMEPVNLATLVREMHERIAASAGEHVRVRFDLPEDVPNVEADPALIRQAILNLVDNAVEAIGVSETPARERHGEIHIATGLLQTTESYLAETYGYSTLTPG